ncbi:MAG: L-threonylcarbamoyladenylate synthase [Bacteroidota bacterium]
MTIISKDITQASALLAQEELVAIPTETVYGLAGNIFSEKAIRKIFQLKKRPLFNPLIVHIHDSTQLVDIVSDLPEKAKLLADHFWPGSLTLILKKKDHIPDLVTAGKDTVGLRMPMHPLTLRLLEETGFPIAAPSANPFGSISPTEAAHVARYFEGELPMILDGGPCQRGIESTIVGFEGEAPVIYRLGAIAVEDIEKVVGPVPLKNKKEKAPDAPGMLSRHYAPQTNTYLVEDAQKFLTTQSGKKIGLLLFNKSIQAPNAEIVKVLSVKGDLEAAAAKLYATLHELDQLNLDMIVAERFPDVGLGKSINDRLLRATKKAD